MSDSNRSAIRYVREVTAGTTPTSPNFQDLMVRSSSLKYNPQSVTDDQLRSDEQIVDQNLVGYDVQGDIQARLTFGSLDDLIESAAASAWVIRPIFTPSAISGTAATVASGGASVIVTDILYGSGFAVAANNGLHDVSASAATTLTATGFSAEASPPAAARLRVVGRKFASGDVTATSTGLACTAGDFSTMGLVVGCWVKVGGSATTDKFATAGSGYARVSVIAAKALTFDILPTGWGVDAGTGKTIKIWVSDYLRNGQTSTSYTFEREYNKDDGTQYWEYFRGVQVGKFGLKLAPRANIEASFEVMGLSASDVVATRGAAVSGGASTIGTPVTVAANTSDVMNTSSNVAQFRINGVSMSGATAVTEVSLDMDRNLRSREGIGSRAAIAIRRGRANIKAGVTAYFENTAMINLIRQDTRTSLDFGFIDPESDAAYYVDIPRAKASDGSIDVGSIDTDITTPMQFQALRHESLGYTLHISRFNYVEV